MLGLVFVYVLGGITFLPLLLAAVLLVAWYTAVPLPADSPLRSTDGAAPSTRDDNPSRSDWDDKDGASIPRQRDDLTTDLLERDALLGAGKDMDREQPSVRIRAGWLTVRNTYEPTPPPASYVSYVVSSYRSLTTRQPAKNSATGDPQAPRDRFWAAIKGTVLFLYDDEEMGDIWAALDLARYEVGVEGAQGGQGIMDGELYAKRHAIVLRRRAGAGGAADQLSTDGDPSQSEKEDLGVPEHPPAVRRASSTASASDPPSLWLPYFIFVRSNTQMEDWYLTLQTLAQPAVSPLLPLQPAVFAENDMDALLQTIDLLPDHIPTRWLNALLGRVFFAFYRTAMLEEFVISRMMRKLSKVKRPSFLKEVVVREVSLGSRPPTISKPMLKSLTRDGEASIEAQVSYTGEVRITLEALASLSLGSKFRSYTVKLVLAVVLRELEGNMLLKIKEPPSNRIWYGFTAMPRMELDVQPVVSERQIKWSMILKPIEARLREIIQESIVLPNMDDIPFFDTRDMLARGGIWADSARKEKHIIGLDGGPAIETSGRTEGEGLEPAVVMGENGEMAPSLAEGAQLGIGRVDTRASTQSAPLLGAGGGKKADGSAEDKGHAKRASWFGARGGGKAGQGQDGKGMSSLASGSASVLGVAAGKAQALGLEDSAPQEGRDGRRTSSDPSLPKVDGRKPDLSLKRERSAETASPSHSQSQNHSFVFPSTETLDSGPPSAASTTSTRSSSLSISTTTPTQRTPPALPRRRPTRAISSGSYPAPEPWPSPTHSPSPSPSLALGESVAAAASASSTSVSSGGTGGTGTSQGTLFQSWKARAADKQALQASVTQARDAMKKWGVNFAAKRRAGGGVVGSMFGTTRREWEEGDEDEDEEEERERERERIEEEERLVLERGRAAANGSKSPVKRRPVLTDGYSSGSALDSEGDAAPRSGRSSRASSVYSSQRTPSFSGGVSGGGSGSRPSSVRSFSSTGGTGPTVKPGGFVVPSAPRTTTELSTSPPPDDPPVRPAPRKSVENPPVPGPVASAPSQPPRAAPRRSSDNPTPAPAPTASAPPSTTLAPTPAPASVPAISRPVPSPIHVQPTTLMTMTVPGIHASHKGEVMALGSSPPNPVVAPKPEPAKPVVVQSVYRLFKGSTVGATETHGEGVSSAPVAAAVSRTSTSSGTAPAPSIASSAPIVPAPVPAPQPTITPASTVATPAPPIPASAPALAPAPAPPSEPKPVQVPSPVPPPMPRRPVPAIPPRPTPPNLPPRRPTVAISTSTTTTSTAAVPTITTELPSSPTADAAGSIRTERALRPDSPTAKDRLRNVAARHVARSSTDAASASSPSSSPVVMDGTGVVDSPAPSSSNTPVDASIPSQRALEQTVPLTASPSTTPNTVSASDVMDAPIPEGNILQGQLLPDGADRNPSRETEIAAV